MGWPVRRRVLMVGVAVLAVAAVVRLAPRAAAPRPNVLLITMDTLRAERLGCYGGPVATPHLDRLAREGLLFEQARCPMPMTRPSHASLFTSMAPRDHGVLHNGSALAADVPTLAEQLRAAGYRTAAFISVWLLGPDSGVLRGFDTVDAPQVDNRLPAADTVERAIAWLTPENGAPFFLWVHLFDAHIPYEPAPPFAPVSPPDVAARLPIASWDTLSAEARAHGGDLPAEILARARALYDGEVRAVDAAVGRLVDALRGAGALDRTVLVLTADHGECFEHGIFFEHSTCLYEGAARVPLVVRYPPAVAANGRRRDNVETMDLAPTILALADVPRPATFRGTSLLDPAAGGSRVSVVQHPQPLAQIVARRQRTSGEMRSVAGMPTKPWGSGRDQFAVVAGDWKAVLSPTAAELYDLASDPGENHDVSAAHPEVVADARAQLDAWLLAHPEHRRSETEISPATRERLRALGYR